MIVCYFNIMCTIILPYKTDSPLVIYPDAILSFTITTQFLKSVRWRYPQIMYVLGIIKHPQFSQGYLLYISRQFC